MVYAICLGNNLVFFYYPAWAQLAGSKFSRRIYLMQYQALSKSKHVELHKLFLLYIMGHIQEVRK